MNLWSRLLKMAVKKFIRNKTAGFQTFSDLFIMSIFQNIFQQLLSSIHKIVTFLVPHQQDVKRNKTDKKI